MLHISATYWRWSTAVSTAVDSRLKNRNSFFMGFFFCLFVICCIFCQVMGGKKYKASLWTKTFSSPVSPIASLHHTALIHFLEAHSQSNHTDLVHSSNSNLPSHLSSFFSPCLSQPTFPSCWLWTWWTLVDPRPRPRPRQPSPQMLIRKACGLLSILLRLSSTRGVQPALHVCELRLKFVSTTADKNERRSKGQRTSFCFCHFAPPALFT